MGDTWVAGAFQFAFAIPNLFRRLLGEGALTAAFIPIFKEKERNSSPAEMWRAANAVISGLLLAATVIVAIVMLGLTVALALQPRGREGVNAFSDDNIKDLRVITSRLKSRADPVSAWLWQQFSPGEQREISAYGADTSPDERKQLRWILVYRLERLAHAGPIY